ncbi:MAG TPA: hypothetical protein VKT51_00990 [Candidatus Eremiobacteraceae bacterium]|nr:hypothetical protein [Candidatus Eremiobacteraceae bacterium]
MKAALLALIAALLPALFAMQSPSVSQTTVRVNVLQDGNPPDWVYFPVYNPPSTTPEGITIGPDGHIWFTESAGHSLVRVEIFGSQHPIELAADDQPGDLAVGSDRKFYMTDNGKNAIDVVTSDGVSTQYPVAEDSGLHGIAEGSDGNIWFGSRAHISKLTPAGLMTRYALNGNPGITSVTAGTDRSVWFAESQASKLARIVPSSGAIASYPIPCAPLGIVTTPDKNIWFTCASAVGRMTPRGMATIYPTTIRPSGSITVGPDHALWFTSASDRALGRITTGGELTYLNPLASFGGQPWTIITGPDGNLWFTDHLQSVGIYVLRQISVIPTGWIATGPGQSEIVTVEETNYSGPWKAVSANPPVATAERGTSSHQFVITSVAHGKTIIEISDSCGNRFDVSVTVH